MKERSPQKVVKSLKVLRQLIDRYNTDWTTKPLVYKFNECIYGEHTIDSICLVSDQCPDIGRTKERSPQKVVKNLRALKAELMSHKQNFLIRKVLDMIDDCLYREFKLVNKYKEELVEQNVTVRRPCQD